MSEPRSQAVTKIRQVFRTQNKPMLLADIQALLPELNPSKISMTLCYLVRQKYCLREQIDNPTPKKRKKVWIYTYSDQRFLEVKNEG